MAGVPSQAGPVSESVRARPAAPLRGLIGWYSGYRQDGLRPTRHRGLPSPYLTLIITLDDPLTVARHPDPADRPGDYRTLVGGLHISPRCYSKTHRDDAHSDRRCGDPRAARPYQCAVRRDPCTATTWDFVNLSGN